MKLFEIAKLKRDPIGMGLEAMHNNEIALVGGMRSGNSKAGQTRLKYMVYDTKGLEGPMNAEETDKREIGYVELFVKDGSGKIIGLVNIHINPKSRKGGFGRKIINSLMTLVDDRLEINDIKKSAISFWQKVGTEFYDSSLEKKVDKPRQHKGTLRGIIRK